MQQFNINSDLVDSITYDGKYALHINLADNGVISLLYVDADDVNAFLSATNKDDFLKSKLITNQKFRKSTLTSSPLAKNLFEGLKP